MMQTGMVAITPEIIRIMVFVLFLLENMAFCFCGYKDGTPGRPGEILRLA